MVSVVGGRAVRRPQRREGGSKTHIQTRAGPLTRAAPAAAREMDTGPSFKHLVSLPHSSGSSAFFSVEIQSFFSSGFTVPLCPVLDSWLQELNPKNDFPSFPFFFFGIYNRPWLCYYFFEWVLFHEWIWSLNSLF